MTNHKVNKPTILRVSAFLLTGAATTFLAAAVTVVTALCSTNSATFNALEELTNFNADPGAVATLALATAAKAMTAKTNFMIRNQKQAILLSTQVHYL